MGYLKLYQVFLLVLLVLLVLLEYEYLKIKRILYYYSYLLHTKLNLNINKVVKKNLNGSKTKHL